MVVMRIETKARGMVGKQATPIRDYETTITLYQCYIATSTTKISPPVTRTAHPTTTTRIVSHVVIKRGHHCMQF